jgi:hypothetical protein
MEQAILAPPSENQPDPSTGNGLAQVCHQAAWEIVFELRELDSSLHPMPGSAGFEQGLVRYRRTLES